MSDCPVKPHFLDQALFLLPPAVESDAHAAMRCDAALFQQTIGEGKNLARFYTWSTPVKTIGYFQGKRNPIPEAASRQTGGGLVEHGEDVTFAIAIASQEEFSKRSSQERYCLLHQALRDALTNIGMDVSLVPMDGAAGTIGPCFSNPVPGDVRCDRTGKKIAGGAQRRTGGAVLHQGTVRLAPESRDPAAAWIMDFLGRIGRVQSI